MFRNSNGHISAMRRVINFCFGSVVSLSGSPDRTALHPCGLAVILKKNSDGPISAMHYSIQFMYVHRLLTILCPRTL